MLKGINKFRFAIWPVKFRIHGVFNGPLIEKLAQLQGIDRCGAFLIIIEIDEHVAALFFP